MKIDKNHPRYLSLTLRENLVRGVRLGITSTAGLIAHGRGEAFDYLLGEKTHPHARRAITAAICQLLVAKKPVLSVNGNTAILVGREIMELAEILDCMVEVNLFHFSIERVIRIENYLRKFNSGRVLRFALSGKTEIPGIASARKTVIRQGIGTADCVFVPLEDGDRCEALIKRGTKVITCDLNPLSRTAKNATVTIVDNIVRAMPLLIQETIKLKKAGRETFNEIINKYDNKKTLDEAIAKMR